VQLAHRAGAEVTATASQRSSERLRRYGADRIIDYTATPVAEAAGTRFDAGELHIDVAGRYPLAELADVHRRAGQGTLPGKVVITP
jgi:NADPH:quinone reductase-like Zn-dependent oxidoreductase